MKHTTQLDDSQEIYIRVEQYDDIFSDFDIRPYSKRALSTDFLSEVKRAAADKNRGGIDLVIYAPANERNESSEATIRERLTEHFQKHYRLLQKDRNQVLRLGIIMIFLGIVAMIAATKIIFEDPTDNMFLSFLVVFLEPAAWFLLWEGMDQILFNSKQIYPELSFYKKMADSRGKIHFHTNNP